MMSIFDGTGFDFPCTKIEDGWTGEPACGLFVHLQRSFKKSLHKQISILRSITTMEGFQVRRMSVPPPVDGSMDHGVFVERL